MPVSVNRSYAAGTVLAAVFSFSSAAQGVDLNAPDRYWKFDETSGTTAADSSGNNIDGTLTNMNGDEWTDGVVGGALAFDGVDDWVNVLDNDGLPASDPSGCYVSQPFTLALWAKPLSDAQMSLVARTLEGWQARRHLRIQKTDAGSPMLAQAFLWDGGDENATGTTQLQTDQWYHLAMVSNTTGGADQLRVFVDGQLEGTAWNGPAQYYHDSWFIGRENNGFVWFHGVMDDVRIYRAALTDQEVSDLYDLTRLPAVSITATDADASEAGSDPGSFTVTASEAGTGPLDVTILVEGTAVDADYTETIGTTVTIPASQTTTTIGVTPVDDGVAEQTETVRITVQSGAGYTVATPASATVTILDSTASTVEITASVAQLTEGDPATDVFTISRTGGPAADVPVTISVAGSAIEGAGAGGDYTLSANAIPVTVVSNEATVNVPPAGLVIAVTTTDDDVSEPTETIQIGIVEDPGVPPAYLLGSPASASVNMVDDELPEVRIIAAVDTAIEDAASPVSGVLMVTRTGDTTAQLTVDFTVSGTAEAADYQPIGTSVVIPVGWVNATIDIVPVNDGIAEQAETVRITVQSGAGYTAGTPASATVTILDGDRTISVALPATALEGCGVLAGAGTVTIPGTWTTDLVIGLDSSDTTELTVPATVTILQGDASATFALTVIEDGEIDGTQGVTVTATLAGWTCIADSTSILDDETQTITVTLRTSATEGDETLVGAGTVAIPGTWTTDLIIGLDSSDETELTVSTPVTIPQGQTSATFDLTIVGDGVHRETQTVTVTASAAGWTSGTAEMDILYKPVTPFGGGCVPGPVLSFLAPLALLCLALARRR